MAEYEYLGVEVREFSPVQMVQLHEASLVKGLVVDDWVVPGRELHWHGFQWFTVEVTYCLYNKVAL